MSMAEGSKRTDEATPVIQNDLVFDHPPRRVVSLVPSLTESLFELGLGEAVAGVTDYCVHPAGALSGLPRIGGPKNPRIDDILKLNPDLVLANREENSRPAVEALQKAGIRVFLSFPQTVRQSLEVLVMLVSMFGSRLAVMRLNTLESSVDFCEAAQFDGPRLRFFCPVWESEHGSAGKWWMTFNRYTYAGDLLRLVGGENVFADRKRRYPLGADLGLPNEGAQDPGDRDTRYPRVTIDEVRTAQPDLILLPDEPYDFNEAHLRTFRDLLEGTPAVRLGKIHLLDGSLITWHGTRLARALQELPQLFY